MADTKKHWQELVEPDDYDAHMIEAGQASVNAMLVKEMFSRFPLAAGSTVYVPGCGTGQLFDFLKPDALGSFRYIFADIKPEFLERLKNRISSGLNYKIIQDDVELSAVTEKADAALVVLLLQHIDWRVGLKNILVTKPKWLFVIEQEQDAKDSEINKNRKLRPSMKKFSEAAKTELLDRGELEDFLKGAGYARRWLQAESVPYTKRMVAFVFEKVA